MLFKIVMVLKIEIQFIEKPIRLMKNQQPVHHQLSLSHFVLQSVLSLFHPILKIRVSLPVYSFAETNFLIIKSITYLK